ncbi:MAG: TonB-dependent receptor, partial [Pedobacter sp.]
MKTEDPMFFVQYEKYFVGHKGKLTEVNKLSSVLATLPDKENITRKWVRSQKLNFKKQQVQSIVKVVQYADQNIVWPKTEIVDQEVIVTNRPTITTQLPSLEENRLFELGAASKGASKTSVTLAGYIKDSKTGETIVGATVSSGVNNTVTTDGFGYYSITLPKGRHTLTFSSSGMKETRRQVQLNDDGKLDVELSGQVASLKAVVVVAEKNSNIKNTRMSVEKLTIKNIKQVPVVFGEADVLRVITTLPGVTSAGEAGTGFNVRGGSVDQNLILFNDATIYNPSHVFGFFSAFNPDQIKGVELYKSAIPEKYGGRLSSVLDVTSKEGNSKKVAGVGGIGPLTSKLTIEGPLFSEKTTFVAGARTTYSNWILKELPDERYRRSRASFYDANLNINHTLNPKNSFYLMGYVSSDKFRLNNDTTYEYGNYNWNIKWKHIFNNKLYGVITGGQDHYTYSVLSEENKLNAFKLGFSINQAHARAAFTWSPNNSHQLEMGFNSIYYQLDPGYYHPKSDSSLVVSRDLQHEQALENGIYIGDRYSINSNLSINVGLRYSLFSYLGPYNVYQYAPGIPRDTTTIKDTVGYNKNKVIKTYQSPEYRISVRYAFSENTSVKASFNTTRQYIHMLSNTTIVSPTDTWKLTDGDIKPQQGMQWSAGLYRNLKNNSLETSVEVYYRTMKNVLDYKSGARLILNQHIAADVISARGKSYGLEMMIKKVSGKLNGWLSYTWSRTLLRQDDPLAGELINKGEYYPASFDKPHNVNFIGNYRFSHRFSISSNIVYTSGRPITLPVAIFELGGTQRVYYSERNQYRVPDYFRADISFILEGNHKV